MSLMPLPAWEEGGSRTSCWGGTGLAFPKQCRNFPLAWELAQHLYYEPKELGPRFAKTNILPPARDAWEQPEFSEKRPYWSNLPLGHVFIELAPQVPADTVTAYTSAARNKPNAASLNTSLPHENERENG